MTEAKTKKATKVKTRPVSVPPAEALPDDDVTAKVLDDQLSPHLRVHEVTVRLLNRLDGEQQPTVKTLRHGYEQPSNGYLRTDPTTGKIVPKHKYVEILDIQRLK